MEIINEAELHIFSWKHSRARKPLANWVEVVKTSAWDTFADVRKTFRSADYIKNRVIFDIGGNNYRLITSVDYAAKRVYVLEMMTHTEYDRWSS